MIGEWSLAIGNPFGLFSLNDNPTVTVGVVSALGMNLSAIDDRYYMNMIQTDASINQGNSGGPLVNSVGEMIGINTIIYTTGTSSGSLGVGFAIPVNKVKRIIEELKANGKIDRNYWTGLTVRDIDQGIADYFDLSRARGVIINELVQDSPADEAGLEVYDIITEINGYKINNTDVLLGILQDYKTGDDITFTVLRDGQEQARKMKLMKKT
jgi:serine protease Do